MVKILIVGGGIGGTIALQWIKRKIKDAEIILIDKKENFEFTPRIVDVLRSPQKEKFLLRNFKMFSKENVKISNSNVLKVNLEKKLVFLDSKEVIDYDYIIISTGGKTNFFGSEKWKKYCLEFKNYSDMKLLREKVVSAIERIRKTNENLKISIIGAGLSGTELAFALNDMILDLLKEKKVFDKKKAKILLIDGNERILKGLPKWIIEKSYKEAKKGIINIYNGEYVSKISEKLIFLKEQSFHSDLIVWVVGIVPNVIEFEPTINYEKGAIPVKETLQLYGYDNAFAIGDCNFLLSSKKLQYPKNAQIALQEGIHAAKNIYYLINKKKTRAFDYRIKGIFLSLGKRRTAAVAYFLNFNGILGWLLREAYYRYIFWKIVRE